jgi:hypothetical protein
MVGEPTGSVAAANAKPRGSIPATSAEGLRLAPGQTKFPSLTRVHALPLFRSGLNVEEVTAAKGVQRATVEGYHAISE